MKINKYKLELVRAQKNIGSLELVRLSKISSAVLGRIKKGADLRPTTISKIAKALEVDVTELIEQED
ncbi:MAG: helix-turn-helix transcriptional regulator [Fusobacterium varium]|uniref:helix-turn-helix domain-containing protein n=1 Tax=Fusobacterium varium TaxID=856 RepID=UPI00242CB388|nr:helix-turn-helix transcriptional regulator [Fusobacterium varium]UYI78523.1 MAG: helix-turn-helix transcriptional regulator [Fusobacterium varium]